MIESFESSNTYTIAGGRAISGTRTAAAAHDGSFGFDDTNGNDWIYRTDAPAQIKVGDQLSAWLNFANAADGRAYLGFGASASGTFALVAAPNTGQLILQGVPGFTNFVNLAAVNQTFAANHWYRLEVDLGTNGTVVGKLFDSDGTTLITQVVATGLGSTAGGYALRATGNDKYWDTITDTAGVNGPLTPAGHPQILIGGTTSGPSQGSAPTIGGTTSGGSKIPTFAAIDSFFLQVASRLAQESKFEVPLVHSVAQADEWKLPF